jgi:hypothetical protein
LLEAPTIKGGLMSRQKLLLTMVVDIQEQKNEERRMKKEE